MSVQAEMSLVGAMFLMCDDTDYVADAVNALSPEMFQHAKTRKIFETISEMYWKGRKIDFATVLGELPQEKVVLTRLAQFVPSISHFGDYIKIIREDWQLSLLQAGMKEIGNSGKDLYESLGDLRELLTKQEGLANSFEDGRTTAGYPTVSPTGSPCRDRRKENEHGEKDS